jgi:hypothetical protein
MRRRFRDKTSKFRALRAVKVLATLERTSERRWEFPETTTARYVTAD